MNINEIKELLATGEYHLSGEKLYTREEWEEILAAEKKAEHFDLLQLTKKIQLNSTYSMNTVPCLLCGFECKGLTLHLKYKH